MSGSKRGVTLKYKFIHPLFLSIKVEGSEAICKKLRRYPSYQLETFDVKLTSIERVGGEGETRLDIRLLVRKSDDGRTSLKVALVKKNEIKDVTFDILNMHRLLLLMHTLIISSHSFLSAGNMMSALAFTTTSWCKKKSLFTRLLGRWWGE